MGNIVRCYLLLAKRWLWMLVLGAAICGGATYGICTFLRPVYQASAYLIVDIGASTHPSITDSLQAVPTFAQLITLPAVLDPVAAQHPGMSTLDLAAMLSVKPQTNTQLIEVDVQADNPRLAADLANQVSQSFARYVNADAAETVRVIPASEPTQPARPRPLQDAGIGAAVGLILALILVSLFEWISNRATSVEQIQDLLGMEILALVPRFSRKIRRGNGQQFPVEKYAPICAGLNVAQANKPFRLLMFTSALAGEGKTFTASNVAIHLAQAGKQVLFIDLNIHWPTLAQQFSLTSQAGLTDLLTSTSRQLPLKQYIQATAFPRLFVLPAGTHQMDFSEFLRSLAATQFFSQLKQTPFDYVLFDAPPLLAVAETQILATSVEALVLVVNGPRTPRRALARTRQILWRLQTSRVVGAVINQSIWPDYADTRPYALAQSRLESKPRFTVEEVTLELPAAATKLIPAPGPVTGQENRRLPDTGENEQIRQAVPGYVIRPTISLSGLTMPNNGLIRRVFPEDTAPSTPRPF